MARLDLTDFEWRPVQPRLPDWWRSCCRCLSRGAFLLARKSMERRPSGHFRNIARHETSARNHLAAVPSLHQGHGCGFTGPLPSRDGRRRGIRIRAGWNTRFPCSWRTNAPWRRARTGRSWPTSRSARGCGRAISRGQAPIARTGRAPPSCRPFPPCSPRRPAQPWLASRRSP